MSQTLRELMVFPIVLGPAVPFYIWQFRTIRRKYPKTPKED